jgi:hypothetical protein
MLMMLGNRRANLEKMLRAKPSFAVTHVTENINVNFHSSLLFFPFLLHEFRTTKVVSLLMHHVPLISPSS